MIKLHRVCIPIGLDCNFRCKYCYRGLTEGSTPTEISPLMKSYLPYIDAEWCQCVCMSGGEPLMYMDTIRGIFSMVKPSVHKKIMTNGSLLTQEIVDYINRNDIELFLSHDGEMTEFLRGRDVLKEPKIVDLVKQVKILTISAVTTKYNCDIMANYRDTITKLGRSNVFYMTSVVYYNGYNMELINGFDYDTFIRSFREYRFYVYKKVKYYDMDEERRVVNFNVNLDGEIVDKNTLAVYGTILDSYDDCLKRRNEIYKGGYCDTANCPMRNNCLASIEQADPHSCMTAKLRGGFL